jgi:glutamine amidotransferase-like uncharacterized protein
MHRAATRAAGDTPLASNQRGAFGIYAGKGASHSWTWLADFLEHEGYSGLLFFDEEDVRNACLSQFDAVAIGGGDPVAMAEALGQTGANELHRFLHEGGIYLGFCAGCYLALDMDEEPSMRRFRLTAARPANVLPDLPPIEALATKAATRYADKYVVHPVREGVVVDWMPEGRSSICFEAPLYGGPPIQTESEDRILGRYRAFAPETLFLVDRDLADELLLGKVAACSRRVGRGEAFLFGPHLENPRYPEANRALARLLSQSLRRRSPAPVLPYRGALPKDGLWRLRGILGDLRIASLSVESAEAVWWIGRKAYEPAKINVFCDAMWRRLGKAECFSRFADAGVLASLASELSAVTELVRQLGRDLRMGNDTLELAEELFPRLRSVTTRFLNQYFASLRFEHSRLACSRRQPIASRRHGSSLFAHDCA